MKLSLSLNRSHKTRKPVLTTIYYYTSIHSKTEKSYHLRINKYKKYFQDKKRQKYKNIQPGLETDNILIKRKERRRNTRGATNLHAMYNEKKSLIEKYKDDTNSS